MSGDDDGTREIAWTTVVTSSRTELHDAAALGDLEKARTALAAGTDVNALDAMGRTPLGVALRTIKKVWVAHNKRTSTFEALIDLLRAAGGADRVVFSDDTADPVAPRHIDNAAIGAEVNGRSLRELAIASDDYVSAQELVADLQHRGEPDLLLAFVRELRGRLGSGRATRLEGAALRIEEPFFWHGDLVVTGNLSIRAHFVVTGDVRVEGVVQDCGPDSMVAIGGALSCHGLYTDGDFTVGTVDARDVVYGYYNDNMLWAETIRARVVIEDDHATEGRIEADHHFDLGRGSMQETLRSVFVPEVFDPEEGGLDKGLIFQRLGHGLPVLR